MAAFVYKFESVKNIKEQLKKKTEKLLAEVKLEIDKVNDEIISYQNELENLIKNFQKQNVKVSDLKFKKSSENILQNKIELAYKKLKKLEQRKNEVLVELEQKSKEHKIFGMLEENMREEFVQQQNKIENNKIDEMAIQKFARGKL